jgi:hypothetical protein
LTRGRRRDSDINDSISEVGRGGVALVVGVKEKKANVGGAGGGGSRDEVLGFCGDRVVAGNNKTGKGGKFMADRAKGISDGIAWGGFVEAAGKKWSL